MRLPCTVTTSREKNAILNKNLKEIKKENLTKEKIYSKEKIEYGYTTYSTTGILYPDYRDIDELKLAILINNGHSFFGGESAINRETGYFKVTIYVD
ncbi:hypothetical protein [Fusobacterium ulcerans]|uniref:hypothetical protein n=1 Tax=Fusobacterium ulcerans TaxID=861 RepID=UPI00309EAA23